MPPDTHTLHPRRHTSQGEVVGAAGANRRKLCQVSGVSSVPGRASHSDSQTDTGSGPFLGETTEYLKQNKNPKPKKQTKNTGILLVF